MISSKWLFIALVIVGASSYGVLSSCIKLAYEAGWNDGQVTLSQVTMGTALLWVIVGITRKSWTNPFRGPWIRLGLIGLFGLSLTTIFYNTALAELNASLSIVLLFQFTWMTIAMDCIASRTWPSRQQLLAVGMILIGTLCAVNIFAADWQKVSVKGIFYGLLSALTYSVFLFFTGRVKTVMHPFLKSAVMLTATLPFVYLLFPPQTYLQHASWPLAFWGLLLGTLGQVIPTITMNIGIPRIGSSLAALLGSMELPVAVVAAFFIVKEPVGSVQWLGMLLILSGIVTAEMQPFARKKRMERN